MNAIEVMICLLLLFMAVPDLCRKFGRPALSYPAFVLFGILLSPLCNAKITSMLVQAGEVGFLLLLFEVGMEIELPRSRELLRPLRKVCLWVLFQYPVIIALASVFGLSMTEAFIAAAAFTACSMSMAFPAWKVFPLADEQTRTTTLRIMVLLELLAVVLLSVETVILEKGVSWWVPIKIIGIGITVVLIARFVTHINKLFQIILAKTTHWRMHFLVLLVLGVCAVGERLGLSGSKTAFVLGLFLSRIEHEGKGLEDYMAPISHRFLIPIFFVGLGLQIRWGMIFSVEALMAFGGAGLLLGLRPMIYRWWIGSAKDQNAFLLFCPNLTIVALAANAMIKENGRSDAAAWLLLTGLFMTVISIFSLPKNANSRPTSPPSPDYGRDNTAQVRPVFEPAPPISPVETTDVI